ncbi:MULTISPECIES: HD domain-containing protein [Caulobacter]|jgi:predicted HD phosphohydrolase|uniref:Putative HD phosphohydrolase n=1 Tax=Caulobacter vibrioides OR37 TaxID=1292034 RepID=R0CZT6_CAUVI|nr:MULTISPECIES: HD domain-containing protein [Caulobacter]ENZ81740.1 putative HD phosphohydrolase [Caulobacter vibrioides OR37]MBQ1561108.1 HD domain-containing protein [Caulobacter sp.]
MTSSPSEALREEIRGLYLGLGERAYGLYEMTQLAHALQSAAHAEAQGLSSAMVMACLLHDVGHMVHDLGEAPAEAGIDDRHEELGADWVAERFPETVAAPIRLHVAAKRYLCSAAPGYLSTLSRDSLLSLVLQGGLMSADEQAAFLAQPHAEAAVALRRIDELAKDKHARPDPIEAFLDRHLTSALTQAA